MSREIKQSTKDGYDLRLKKLNDGKIIDNYAFLYDVDVIMDKISNLSPGTQRNYIISIINAINIHAPILKTKMLPIYTKIMDKFNLALKINTTKSPKQTANWATQNEINEVFNTLRTNTLALFQSKKKHMSESDWSQITNTIVLALYVLQPPRRILDYSAMVIVKSLPKILDQALNYYELSSHKFIFQNYKTAGTYSTQITVAPEDLATLLEAYVKIHPMALTKVGIPLICKLDGTSYPKTYSITKILNKIFKYALGKQISVSMLRNIYLTSRFAPASKDQKDTATAMGTSVGMLQNQYVKLD